MRVSQKNALTPPTSPFFAVFSHTRPLLLVIAGLLVVGVHFGGSAICDSPALGSVTVPVVKDGDTLGLVELNQLSVYGELRLAFVEKPTATVRDLKLEWWQLAERQDRPGYPRIDPQSGGSGLPGAKGEDEDPAYYSSKDYENPELAARVTAEGKYWLLDRPTHDSGFRFESWLVERSGPKSIRPLIGIRWGITVHGGEIVKLHHPEQILRGTGFDWAESLRISGFGTGWEIQRMPRRTLP